VAQGPVGCDTDSVEISPLVGYRALPQLDFGLELTYRWLDDIGTPGISPPAATASPSSPTGLFARGEYEYLNHAYPLDAGAGRRPGT
jgi:hypothetical protein